MKKLSIPHLEQQEKVNAYFQSESAYWEDIYTSDGVFAEFIRNRHTVALAWIDSLAIAPGTRMLEIGCGAGFMAIALAERGYRVHAIDSVEDMIELARRHATESGMDDLLSLELGNVYSLAFENDSFDLVIAIGVMGWLDHPKLAIQEMARVTKPGGYVILTAANQAALNSFLDPLLNPMFRPLKLYLKGMLERVQLRRRLPSMASYDHHFIDEALASAELDKIRSKALGFGPFSLFRRTILQEALGVALQHWLQRLADKDVPGIRSIGRSHLVLARKWASRSLEQSIG